MNKSIIFIICFFCFQIGKAQFNERSRYTYDEFDTRFSINQHFGSIGGQDFQFEFQMDQKLNDNNRFAIYGFGNHGIGLGYATSEGEYLATPKGVYLSVYETLGFIGVFNVKQDFEVAAAIIPSYLDLAIVGVNWGFGFTFKARVKKLVADFSTIPLHYKKLGSDHFYVSTSLNYGFHEKWMVGIRYYNPVNNFHSMGLVFTKVI